MRSYKTTGTGFTMIAALIFSINGFAQKLPYQNPNLSSEERAKDWIARLTLEEKRQAQRDGDCTGVCTENR